MRFNLLLTPKELSRAGPSDARVKLPSLLLPCPLRSQSLSVLSDFLQRLPSLWTVVRANPHCSSAGMLNCCCVRVAGKPWAARDQDASRTRHSSAKLFLGHAIKSQGRGNLQVIFGFRSFRNWGERDGMCSGSLMKSGTFEVNGVAIFGGYIS